MVPPERMSSDQKLFLDKAESMVFGALSRLERPNIMDRLVVRFEDTDFYRTVALAEMTKRRGREAAYRICIQWPLWELLTDDERTETLAHETCHIVQFSAFDMDTIDPHGIEWKSMMRVIGYPNAEAIANNLNYMAACHVGRRIVMAQQAGKKVVL